uniref:Colanic acid biosynthesis glycosyltransferase WcaL n=1 Tax=Desulfobacca acetoxidans TaxID=60893 RepID=A0A7C5AMF5_9BACT
MPPLAFYFSTFPALSETLVRSQVRAARELGLPVLLVANRAPELMHPGDQPLREVTQYLRPVGFQALVRGLTQLLAARPSEVAAGLRACQVWAQGSPRQFWANLKHLAGALYLLDFLRRHQVSHVHVHYAFGAADVALFLDLVGAIPYSLSIHGTDVLLDQPLLARKLARARFVISNCRYHIRRLRKKFPDLKNQRFYLVRGGVELGSCRWAAAPPPPPPPPLRLLNVARLAPVKDQDLLLEALALLKGRGVPVECRIVGEGPERPRLEALICHLGLVNQVALLGARPEEEVARFYEECHVVVLSSRSEGTPMIVIEAMAKARPVVAPHITALPEMVSPGVTGWLCRPGEARDLAEKIESFWKKPDYIAQMGAAGRIRAEELFDLEKNTRIFLAVLAQEIPALALRPQIRVAYE